MKKDWTYKKLGEFISEYSVKNKTQEDIPVYSVTNDQGFCQGYFDKDVSSKDKSNYKIVPYGFFAYNPSRINVGSIACQTCEERVIVSPLYNVFKVSENISQPYLLYYLKSPVANIFINAYARGAVRNNFSLKKMGDMLIPIPPLSIQRSIVAELDLLHSVISKKKEQLRELDNLAQSLFYQMFGDPITNPMGWEIKKLGEVCDDLFAGGDVPKNDFSEEKNDVQNVPIYANGIKNEGLYGYTSKPRVLSPAVTISGRGTIGASFIRTVPFLPIIRLIVAIPSKKVNLVYFAESIKLLNFEGNGISIPQLTIPKVKEYKILLPPLSLQQSFAAKVEAIEEQKQAITQSIQHTEALLAQRMDQYFG